MADLLLFYDIFAELRGALDLYIHILITSIGKSVIARNSISEVSVLISMVTTIFFPFHFSKMIF